MGEENTALLTGIVVCGIVMAILIYRGLTLGFTRPAPVAVADQHAPDSRQPVFLFDGNFLVDATPSAVNLVAARPNGTNEYNALLTLLKRQFPDVSDDLETLDDDTRSKVLTSDNLGLTVTLERRSGMTRVSLGGPESEDHSGFAEIERAAQSEELALLRNLTDNAPQMIWQEDDEGQLLWANKAYLTFSDDILGLTRKSAAVWPSGQVFADLQSPPAGSLSPVKSRCSVTSQKDGGEYWFDITSVPQAGGVLHYAFDASEAVRAKLAKQDFQQTLSKTFAQLATGLAIFDQERKLTIFNPAMLELTGLPIEFLSNRPSIQMVLDRLRDAGRLPEPKNYTSWRDQFTAVENAAENGDYCETWNLPEGQTFRVTGRPYPDGALAFLFEDISAEILLTQRFRSEIETAQAVLDTLDEAIAVFSSANTLVMSNTAYEVLWGLSDMESVTSHTLRHSIRLWKSKSVPTRIWPNIERAAAHNHDRQPWSDTMHLIDGRQATCHAVPLSGGMTLVKFVISAVSTQKIRKVEMGDPVPRLAKT